VGVIVRDDADYVEYVQGRLTWLRRVAYLLCQDWHAADDLVQVTITRLFVHWARARRLENLDGHVRTILVRAFLGERRAPWGRRVVLNAVVPEAMSASSDWDAVLDVRGALLSVPARQRATLVLRFYCDLDIEQAAAALGCSPGTVKSQTAKGLANMRRILEPAGVAGPGGGPRRAGGTDPPVGGVTMDETDVQTMLRRLADTAAPPARIDVGRAVSDGRRGKRWRHARIAGSVLAAGAAAGAAVALLVVPGSRAAGLPPATSVTARPAQTPAPMPATAPTRFDPLVPYASFGWLPGGYALDSGNRTDATSTTRDVQLIADHGTTLIDLDVHAKGACWHTGPASLPALYCSNPLGGNGPDTAVSRAPDVNGKPAFWAVSYRGDGGGALTWEYAPGAWAAVEMLTGKSAPPTAAERPLLSRVAATVKYGLVTPLAFPYWVTGIPANWAVTVASFTEPSGRLADLSVSLGPRADSLALTLDVQPTAPGDTCPFVAGQSSYVTLDGARAVLQVLTEPGRWETVCAADAHGFLIDDTLEIDEPNTSTPVPGEAGLGGVMGIAERIHLLGAGARTTDPLR
jgi:DNA-directed RNA polymerase specialized sigma24 family protein